MPPTVYTYTHTQAPLGSRRPCPAPSSSLRTLSRSSTPSSRPWPATRCALIYCHLHAHLYGLTTIPFIHPPATAITTPTYIWTHHHSTTHPHKTYKQTNIHTPRHPPQTHPPQTVFLRDLFAGEGKVVLTPEDCQVPHPICDLSLEAYPDAPICPPTSYKARGPSFPILCFPLLAFLCFALLAGWLACVWCMQLWVMSTD